MSQEERYAGFWIRLLADIIDSILLTIVSCLIEAALLAVFYLVLTIYWSRSGEPVPSFTEAFNPFWIQLLNAGLYFCVAFPYYVWGHFRWCTTLGKRVLGVYVLDAKAHKSISLKQSMIRFFGYLPSYAFFAVGFLMVAFHPEKRGFHDILAGTISVRRGKSPLSPLEQ